MVKKIAVVIEDVIYGINGFHINKDLDVKNHVMTNNEKEKLYNKLNDLLDMMHEGEAKNYLKDLINQIYYDQL
jgi:outer membrane protein assembly factor BamD (BamD/ComL family)